MLRAEGRLKETLVCHFMRWVTSSPNSDEAETFNAAFASSSDTGDGGCWSPGQDGHGWGNDELTADLELVWDLLLHLSLWGPLGFLPGY